MPGNDPPKIDHREPPLTEGRDFYFDERGLMVLSADYLRRRGTCCKKGCRHCPFGYGPDGLARDLRRPRSP